MAKKGSLWELMNRDVAAIVGRKDEPGTRGGQPQSRVEKVWAEANRKAQQLGVPVQDVLREMGFDIAAPAAPDPEVEEQKREMLKSLNWDVDREQAGKPAANPFDDLPGNDALKAVADVRVLAARIELFSELTASQVSAVLDAAGAASDWWAAATSQGLSGSAIETAVRTLPFYPPKPKDEEFAEFLMVSDVVSFKEFRAASRDAESSPLSTFGWMSNKGQISEDAWVEALAKFTGIPARPSKPRLAKASDRAVFPTTWVERLGVVPIAGSKVAFPFAPDDLVRERLSAALGGGKVNAVLVSRAESEALQAAFMAQTGTKNTPAVTAGPGGIPRAKRSLVGDYTVLQSAVESRSAVELVRMLFQGALQSNATDIHLERYADKARVRYRIDGVLHQVMNINTSLYDEVIARVKILADMDITERRRPQDGHLHLNLGGTTYDLRIASVPTKRGEKIAIRLASTGRIEIRLDSLGLVPEELEKLRDIITRPYGIVLASGPVGSGKTTTLYACLNEFDREQTNVATIEDPVEIELDGANQVEVNYGLGLDFATGLRALLRQDPDTLLIGEIRDEETAAIAARAGMTGRMVFSTLHANESVGAVTTLRNFGLGAHLVASALQGVIAQRLLRKLCESCKTKGKATAADQELFKIHGLTVPKPFVAWTPVGCEDCYGSGYAGRLGVFEVLRVDKELRALVLDGASERELRETAINNGLRSLQQDAIEKIHNGLTSMEEYRRVLRF
ncbi:MAG: type II secretory ATPase GspE/PulE/Tfp pilus assembly ATPase PilB-like protein [Bradymonadia bacterium]|jgi:type II secretory ATPase GspE/PulE/Tfp pilus assembly ATPase PilB-like protein